MLLAFLAFVVLLAGFVAYSADNIARRAGRRHLRLFGLRPKTTALIVAVAAGMGISLASMLAFFALNRQAIRNIEQADLLRRELSDLQVDVKAVKTDLTKAQQERDSANARAEEARKASQAVTGQLSQAKLSLKSAQASTEQLKVQTVKLNDQTLSLKNQAQELQTRVSRLSTLQAELEEQARKNRQSLAASQSELTRSQSELAASRGELSVSQQELVTSKRELTSSQNELISARNRASNLDLRLAGVQDRIAVLDSRNALAQQQATQAQKRAAAAQERVDTLQGQISELGAARQAVTAQRDSVTRQREAVAGQLAALQGQLTGLQAKLTQAQAQASQATDRATQANLKATLAQKQLSSLTQQRDVVQRSLSSLQKTVADLKTEAVALKNDNDNLRFKLSDSQASVRHLEDEYSRATTELSASRNAELSFSKNSIVYGGVVPSVRNLDGFLQSASSAAASRGARGNPAVRLAASSRQALESTLRGLNASTFVLCRASGNAAAGFAVDLSCDAQPNTLLYSHGSVIRKASINLKGGEEALRGQLQELIGDAVLDLTRRGVPLENVLNGGLNTDSLYSLLKRLASRGGSTAVVGVMPRGDVKPSTPVELYADIVQ